MVLRALRLALTASAGLASLGAPPVMSASEGAPWTLSQDHSDRGCPLSLHFDSAGAAGSLSMPAGCRRALPAITAARTWSFGADGLIQLRDATGQSLLTLGRRDDGAWHGDDESGRSYTLVPPGAAAAQLEAADAASQGPVALAGPQIIAPDPEATIDRSVVRLAAASAKPAASPSPAAAGRYAVMRGDRDTGCMVTLEGGGRGVARARLAPACRDQGITIFDPVSWQMKGADLMLTARKGHSISLVKDDGGVWIKMPKDAKALGLKPL